MDMGAIKVLFLMVVVLIVALLLIWLTIDTELFKLKSKIYLLTTELDEYKKLMGNTNGKNKTIENVVDELNFKIVMLQCRLDTMELKLNGYRNGLDRFNYKEKEILERFDNVTNEIHSLMEYAKKLENNSKNE